MLILGELFAVLAPLSLSYHSGQLPRKNYSTFGTLVHVTPLSGDNLNTRKTLE
jgi:hypothetical protein